MPKASFPPGLTVGFVYATAPTSRGIEWYEAGVGPSHATTLVSKGYVIDARFSGGVKARPISYLAGSKVRWLRIPASKDAVGRVVAFLESQRGQPYAWRDILAFAVPALFKKATGAKHPWMCSYLAAAAQVAGQVIRKPVMSLERINPLSLLEIDWQAGALNLPGPQF